MKNTIYNCFWSNHYIATLIIQTPAIWTFLISEIFSSSQFLPEYYKATEGYNTCMTSNLSTVCKYVCMLISVDIYSWLNILTEVCKILYVRQKQILLSLEKQHTISSCMEKGKKAVHSEFEINKQPVPNILKNQVKWSPLPTTSKLAMVFKSKEITEIGK